VESAATWDREHSTWDVGLRGLALFSSLPESVISSDCKIVYIYRNIKDVINSSYHFILAALSIPLEDVSFKETFDEFCQGISAYGPYWDHILGYWKASQERPGRILFLKYEDMKKDPKSNVKKLAEFVGYPFSIEEGNAGETLLSNNSLQENLGYSKILDTCRG
nr:flavonol 4'-sulfotransferase [Tanacetum cinerariifolium]